MRVKYIDKQIEKLHMCEGCIKVIDRYRFHYITKLKQKSDFEIEYNHTFNSGELTHIYHIDVIGLHEHNRVHGYISGDGLIRQVANDIRLFTDESTIYHISGDEFIILSDSELAINVKDATTVGFEIDYTMDKDEVLAELDLLMRDEKKTLKRRRNDI